MRKCKGKGLWKVQTVNCHGNIIASVQHVYSADEGEDRFGMNLSICQPWINQSVLVVLNRVISKELQVFRWNLSGLLFFMSTPNIFIKCATPLLKYMQSPISKRVGSCLLRDLCMSLSFTPFPKKGQVLSWVDLCWALIYPFKLWNCSWVPSEAGVFFWGVILSVSGI